MAAKITYMRVRLVCRVGYFHERYNTKKYEKDIKNLQRQLELQDEIRELLRKINNDVK